MKKLNSRAKGAAGERELSEFLRDNGWPARRGQQRSGVDQADVIDGPEGWHIECKRVENLNVWKAYEQAERDAGLSNIPMVAMRRNRSDWLAVVQLGVLLDLIKAVKAARAERAHEVDAHQTPAQQHRSAAHREVKDPLVRRLPKGKRAERDFLAEVLAGC